jgi:hypothetical protein
MNIQNYVKLTTIIIFSFFVAGCLNQASVVRMTPQKYSINCTGWPMTMETCIDAARSRCPNGYVVLAPEPAYVAGGTLLAKELAPNRVQIRGMVVQCR